MKTDREYYQHYYGEKIPVLVALMAEAGSGKDYSAKIFEKEHGFTTAAFATKIRKYIELIDPYIFSSIRISTLLKDNSWDDLKNQYFSFTDFNLSEYARNLIVSTVRKFMQVYGEAGRDAIHKDVWIDGVLPSLRTYYYNWRETHRKMHNDNCPTWRYADKDLIYPRRYLIRDLRRENEARRIKLLGGYVIKIINPNLKKEDDWRQHKTETDMNKVIADYILINDIGGNNSLADQVSKIVEDIENKEIEQGLKDWPLF